MLVRLLAVVVLCFGVAACDSDDPYPGAEIKTEKPGPPPFKSDTPITCD